VVERLTRKTEVLQPVWTAEFSKSRNRKPEVCFDANIQERSQLEREKGGKKSEWKKIL